MSAAPPVVPTPPPDTAPPPGSFFSALTGRSVLIALVLAVVVAAALNPLFLPPFPVLLGRTLFLSMALLLAFTAARQWSPRWLPRWMAQVLAVVIAAPLATLLVYLLSVGGNVSALLALPERVTGIVIVSSVSLVLGLVLALGALYRERDAQAHQQELRFALERATLERQALDARLSLLQAQIEPHFLFNTLANVQALVESGSPRAAEVLKSLIAYLRAAMPKLHGDAPTLGSEEALVRAYLELMFMRMPDRLQYQVEIDPALRALRFPAMALLTLVENAVRHGVDPSEQGGRIEVGARNDAADGSVHVWVADTGVGMAEAATPGTGLTNLRQRMQAFFGPGARLELTEQTPHGVRAELIFTPAP
ncbi:sensor histidine kinase [Ideonella sp. BN130291]|uniref:sensor histidine kinase n=1 Tax=Ideonella sp. BN130291 TaxID=3112940 RepID=UPI002E26CA51|nr:histidine kinase [Ideonella sp. BN130291]